MSNILCLDIGGTNIKYGVFENDRLIYNSQTKTNAGGGLAAIMGSINNAVMDCSRFGFDGIGISSAGDVDSSSGTVIYATSNLPGFTGLALADTVSQQNGGCPVVAINDAHAALYGELSLLDNPQCGVAMITLGTGVGGAYAQGGTVLEDYNRTKLGHIVLFEDGKQCNCGKRGCAEQYVSALALLRRFAEKGINVHHGADIFNIIKVDSAAREIFGLFLADLALLLGLIDRSLNPQFIIIGGGLSESPALFTELNAVLSTELAAKLRPARLGNLAGIYGAWYFYRNKKESL